jgi:DNA polymerase I-like protein with 3'-5' exonuclease and polymerase domains
MRRMFCADDGWRLISTDLEQAESRVVAGLVWAATGDDTYWRACESGDLHTQVCKMAWPELEWNGDAAHDRAIANRPYPGLGKYSYRDVAKRIGHGSNYRGSAFGIAQAVGIPPHIVQEFQARYFRAFPSIAQWHELVAVDLREHQYLDTPLGRRRYFFSRLDEDKTLREAIAYGPQSTVGELLNYIMWRVWARSLPEGARNVCLPPERLPRDTILTPLPVQLLLQNHDAFLLQTPETTDLPNLIEQLNSEFMNAKVPFTRNGEVRHMAIPGEFVTGWNWAYKDKGSDQAHWEFVDGNPDGLAKWTGADTRRRQQGAHVSPGDWLR